MAAAQSDALVAYEPKGFPTIEGGDQRFITTELQKIRRSISLLVQVVKEIDARCVAHGI